VFDENLFPKSAPGFNKAIDLNIDSFMDKMGSLVERTSRLLSANCSICDSSVNVEMHHVRHLRKSNSK
jgi:hypothetical protein